MPIDAIKKSSKQYAKAINDIGTVLDEDDPLSILLAFSGDPIGSLQPLVSLIAQILSDVEEVDKLVAIRNEKLSAVGTEQEEAERYKADLLLVDNDIKVLGELR